MPADTYGAIFAYNHADWYVAEVLANAACYAAEVGGAGARRRARRRSCRCSTAARRRPGARRSRHEYLRAFEDAAARYELGKRGVWALAAVARLESNFGRGMSKEQLRERGPLGLDPSEWSAYAVDGDEDGRIRHADPVDSAATLARLIWSRGSLSAGIFTHNQAEWYVQAVLGEAERDRRQAARPATSTGRWRRSAPASKPPAPARSSTATSPAPPRAPGPRSRRRSPRPTRSPPPPTSGAAATAPGTPTATTAPARVSFALYGAGLLDTPLDLRARWTSYGEDAPRQAGSRSTPTPTHTYMAIAGLRFDTAGERRRASRARAGTLEPPYPEGFVVRHPAGY